ncbi:TetR/AcrR family transcriptional regulator [Agromyces larvae]|uniref:TetR/AcrR family transcriptional regulator n=1 Tax=Agromyces larvae TaxID=2929802 RepID=A0ABY4BY72_9MICO|nr:helix-turn-helix domain-containing protein [Agromyces larvae]UOE44172.1 TetR/AcrR family transcriptional regulator [Agromyces larvae]
MSEAVSTRRVRLPPAERRERIIAAARDLYRERDYASVSMEELAQAAGVTRGLLNHYFGSKRDLFLAVLAITVRLPVGGLPDLDGRPRRERAARVIGWILDGAIAYGQEWVTTSGAEGLHDGSDVQAIVDAADDRAAQLVIDAVGADDTPPTRARVRALAPLIKALCREWLQRGTIGRDDILEIAVPALLAAVGDAADRSG